MRLTNAPEALPGSCLKCGCATREFFIDLEISLEWHGALYLCSECLQEAADQAGYLSPQRATTIKNQIDELEKKVFALTKKEAGLEVAIGGFIGAGLNPPDNIIVERDGSVHLVERERTSEGEEDLGERETDSSESSSSEGLADVRSDSERTEFTLNL